MSTESLTNTASNASSSAHTKQHSSEQSQLSDSIPIDLTTTSQLSKKAATNSNKVLQQSVKTTAATPTDSPQSSPTKSTPTKSRNKRRNDAKKRSANNKKQQPATGSSDPKLPQQQSEESQVTTIQPKDINEMSSNGEQERRTKENFSEITQKPSSSQSPSPCPAEGNQNKQQESKNVDSGLTTGSVDHEELPGQKSLPKSNQDGQKGESATTTNDHHTRNTNDTNSLRRKQRENRELKEQIKQRDMQLQKQMSKIKDLEASLVSTTRTCGQFEKLLQNELTNRTRLEAENESLSLTVSRLKNQINAHEKDRSANNELIRVLNATLMERETEVSILKLKMTRMQTTSSTNVQNSTNSNSSVAKQDPCKAFTMAGRSNSEFTRNSYARSSMIAEAASARSSTSRLLQSDDRDASVWANVPEELTPSKRPIMLERSLPPIYDQYRGAYGSDVSQTINQTSTPIARDRRYRTLPRSMKSPLIQEDSAKLPSVQQQDKKNDEAAKPMISASVADELPVKCIVTNLDESNNTSRSSANRSSGANSNLENESKTNKPCADAKPGDEFKFCQVTSTQVGKSTTNDESPYSKEGHSNRDVSHYSTISNTISTGELHTNDGSGANIKPPSLPARSPSTPVKISLGFKKILDKFKRSESSAESRSKVDLTVVDPPTTPKAGPFQRQGNRSTLIGPPSSFRAQMSPHKAIDFQTDKPFAEWDTNMLVDWLTMIGLSMYATQCRRWVKCGVHIMNATPAEVDKGLGITNHLHRKKLRLAISELNGDCDKITKAAAKLDYLWVARWLDDIGLPQYKEAFINARVDGRVLNYLTIEDLVSMGVKSLLHHSSIRCGIRVLRSINFDLQLLKRRATAEEIEQMSNERQTIDTQADNSNLQFNATSNSQPTGVNFETGVPLWTCHRVMEWLRMIDFAEFAPNLRGSGVHGGLIIYEDAFNNDTMSALLSIPSSRTLLRRHLSTFFQNLIGDELVQRKSRHKEVSTSQRLNPSAEIKTPKKSPLWFTKLKSSRVGQDGMDEYLCPMYPVEPHVFNSPSKKPETGYREGSNLPRIPESLNI